MSKASETASKASKPKIPCGLEGCIKEYPKSYMKTHQKSRIHVPSGPNDTTEVSVIETNDTDEALSGGTQELVDVIDVIDNNEALETELEIFDEISEYLLGDQQPDSRATPELIEKEVVLSVLDGLFHSVNEVLENKDEGEKEQCEECKKYKEVEQHKEKILNKSEKEKKALGDKLKSMAGQRRFHHNKSKDLEKELEDARKKIEDMQKRIAIMEKEKSTSEALQTIRFTAAPTVPEVQEVSEVEPEATLTDSTAETFKCRKCEEERENIQSLSEHMKIKHPNNHFKCPKCPQKYPFKSSLRAHIKITHPTIVHQCSVCKTAFLRQSGLIAHRASRCKTPTASGRVQGHQTQGQQTQGQQTQGQQLQGQQMQGQQMQGQQINQLGGRQCQGQQQDGQLQHRDQVQQQQGGQVNPQVLQHQVGQQQQGVQVQQQQGVHVQLQGGQIQLQGSQVQQQGAFVQHQGGQQQRGQVQQQQGGGVQPTQPGLMSTESQNPVQWLPRLKCKQCRYETNTQNELVHHIETNHQVFNLKCDKCFQSFTNSETLVTHIVQSHTSYQQGERQRNTLDNGVWDCGFCGQNINGNEARDMHICGAHPHSTEQQQQKRLRQSQEPCNRGPQCHFKSIGKCYFRHVEIVESARISQVPRRSTGKRDMWCSFQDKCNRRTMCTYKHIDEERDFVQTLLTLRET